MPYTVVTSVTSLSSGEEQEFCVTVVRSRSVPNVTELENAPVTDLPMDIRVALTEWLTK